MNRATLALSAISVAAAAAVAALAGFSPRETPAAAAPLTTAAADTWNIDNGHSSIVFRTTHFVTDFYGRFNTFSGSFSIDEANPSASSVNVTVQADSVDTAIDGRDKHLKSPDFFNTAVNPTATFTSTSVSKSGETWNITGDLTINGVTKSVTGAFRFGGIKDNPRGGKVSGLNGEVKINRQDFNVKYGAGLLGDEVTLLIGLEGTQK